MPKPLKILQASAGSGKTYNLTAHYLTLLFSGENKYREILAVTFTNKATEEMKTRILEVLEQLAKGDEKVNDVRDILLKAHPELKAEGLKLQADKIYRKILHDYSRFSVSTIDGFVQKIIRGFAFELGLDSGYALEMNFDKVKQELADKLDKELDKNPNLLQWIINLALERINGNKSWNYKKELLDLAGEIFKERYKPFETAMDSLLTESDINAVFNDFGKFTKQQIEVFESEIKAMAESGHRIFTNSGITQEELYRKSQNPLLKLSNLSVLGAKWTENIQSLEKIIDEPAKWFPKGKTDALFDELNPKIKKLVEHYQANLPNYVLAKSVNDNFYFLRLMQEMALLLKTYRAESGNLLISDAQYLLSGITGADKQEGLDNPSFIWEKTGNRYKHFLFDEFQDTSDSQWNNFKPLLSNAIAAPTGKLIDHLIVGDVKQSIYRWRNGDWNILHQKAKHDIGEYNIVDDNLEENYRSTENIIQFNNHLFQHAPKVLQEQLNEIIQTDANENVQNWWQAQGYHDVIKQVYANAKQNTHGKTLKGGYINFNVIKETEDGEKLISEKFKEIAMQKTIQEIADLKQKGYQEEDICILVRKNTDAVLVVEGLMKEGIGVISGEALMLANNKAINLIINTLQVMVGLPKNTALYKANCISLFAQLQNKTVEDIHWFKLESATLDTLKSVLPSNLCTNWRHWLQLPLPELFEKLIEAYGLHQHKTHLAYLLALRDIVGQFALKGDKGISAFLTYWDEEGSKKTLPSSESAKAIQVITIHKSKGLAFKAVLIPFCNWDIDGLTNGLFWVNSTETPYKSLQSIPLKYKKDLGKSAVAKAYYEELLFNYMDNLNMLYVATTRCKEYLSITVQGKKEDKKNGKEENKKVNNTSDLLVRTLEDSPIFNYSEEDKYLFVDEPVELRDKKPAEPKPEAIVLNEYPLSDRLSTVLDRNLRTPALEILSGNQAGKEGSILHEVLAEASTTEDIDAVLQRMLSEGYFKADELENLQSQAQNVLSNPALQNILKQDYQVLNERSIIGKDGKSYRPDKVLIKDKEVIVVDYKFTQAEQNSHIKQIHHYKNLLLDMGYKKVDTYLFYAKNNNLLKG